jgi:MFS family permease
MGTFMLLLDVTIVNVALPDIQQALNSSFSDLQWIVDAYALTLAAFLLTAQSTGFVRNLEGKVVVSLYSSGAIGRLVPDNVAGLVRYIRGHTAASA